MDCLLDKQTGKRFTTQEILVLYMLVEYTDYTRFQLKDFEDGTLAVYEYGVDKTDCFTNLAELIEQEPSLDSLLMRLGLDKLTGYQVLAS